MCIYVAKVYSRVTNIYARGAEPSGRGHGRRGWVGDRPFSLALVLGRARPLQSKSLLLQCLLMGGSVSSAPEFPLASSQLDQFLASTNGVPAVVCRTVADPTPTPARSPPGVPPTQSVPILLRFPSLRICKKGRFFFCCFFPASFFFFFPSRTCTSCHQRWARDCCYRCCCFETRDEKRSVLGTAFPPARQKIHFLKSEIKSGKERSPPPPPPQKLRRASDSSCCGLC